MTSIVLLCALLAITVVNGQDGPPEEPDSFSEEDTYDCFYYIFCEAEKEIYDKGIECLSTLDDEDNVLLHEWHTDCGYDLNGISIEDTIGYFCDVPEEEDRKSWFKTVVKNGIEKTTDSCKNDKEDPVCKRWDNALTSMGDMIKEKKEGGECGCEDEK